MSGRDWNAASYDRVSTPQVEMALPVLDRLPLDGDETVLDAGCGSGRVTELLLERLPRGHVVAVDSAPSMVEHAREALGDRATVLCQSLTELELDEPVDAVFSNAVFHWIGDHERALRAARGRAQAGRQAGRAVRRQGQHRRVPAPGRRGGRRAALRRAHDRLPRALELRRAGRDRGSACAQPASTTCAAGSSPGRSPRTTRSSSPAPCAWATTSRRCPRTCADRTPRRSCAAAESRSCSSTSASTSTHGATRRRDARRLWRRRRFALNAGKAPACSETRGYP